MTHLFSLLIVNTFLLLGIDSHQEPEIKEYVQKIYEISENNLDGRHLEMRFKTYEDKDLTIGQCFPFKGIIHINRERWKTMSEKNRIVLVVHEVTHCVKFELHLGDYDTSLLCPRHYMYKTAPSQHCFPFYYKEYIKQMRSI